MALRPPFLTRLSYRNIPYSFGNGMEFVETFVKKILVTDPPFTRSRTGGLWPKSFLQKFLQIPYHFQNCKKCFCRTTESKTASVTPHIWAKFKYVGLHSPKNGGSLSILGGLLFWIKTFVFLNHSTSRNEESRQWYNLLSRLHSEHMSGYIPKLNGG